MVDVSPYKISELSSQDNHNVFWEGIDEMIDTEDTKHDTIEYFNKQWLHGIIGHAINGLPMCSKVKMVKETIQHFFYWLESHFTTILLYIHLDI